MKVSLLLFFLIGLKTVVSSDLSLHKVIYGTRRVTDKILRFPLIDSSVQKTEGLLGAELDPDTFRNVTELIVSKGYPVENYHVRTPDGYILSMQRIPHGRNERLKNHKRKEVALLFHGLMATSDTFVIEHPRQSLGFVLADAGYDVWMGNFRGNRYSNKHVKYTIDDQEFWDYTLDHLAEIDMPVMMKYILKTTRSKQIYLIGQSLGSTVAFASLSENPRLNKKIKLFIAISPVAYAENLVATARLCTAFSYYDMISGPTALRPVNKLDDDVFMLICGTSLKELTCKSIFTYYGSNPTYSNETRFGVYTAHFPTVCSTRVMAHYGQLIESGRFCKFDYGLIENWNRYHRIIPPSYNLGAVTCPVQLIWSDDDCYSNPTDVDMIRQELPNIYDDYRIPLKKFTHLDFTVANNLNKVMFPRMIDAMKRIALKRRRGG